MAKGECDCQVCLLPQELSMVCVDSVKKSHKNLPWGRGRDGGGAVHRRGDPRAAEGGEIMDKGWGGGGVLPLGSVPSWLDADPLCRRVPSIRTLRAGERGKYSDRRAQPGHDASEECSNVFLPIGEAVEGWGTQAALRKEGSGPSPPLMPSVWVGTTGRGHREGPGLE